MQHGNNSPRKCEENSQKNMLVFTHQFLEDNSFLCRFIAFSKFGDIFDEDHFIGSLRKYIRVVKELPEDAFVNFDHNISMIPNMRTKAFSSESYYLQKVLPKLLELGSVLLFFLPLMLHHILATKGVL